MVTRFQAAIAEGLVDVTNQIASFRTLSRPQLRGRSLEERAGVAPGFRLAGKFAPGVIGEERQRVLRKLAQTGRTGGKIIILNLSNVGEFGIKARQRILESQKLTKASIRGLEARGIIQPRRVIVTPRPKIDVREREKAIVATKKRFREQIKLGIITPAFRRTTLFSAQEKSFLLRGARARVTPGKLRVIEKARQAEELKRAREFFKRIGGPFAPTRSNIQTVSNTAAALRQARARSIGDFEKNVLLGFAEKTGLSKANADFVSGRISKTRFVFLVNTSIARAKDLEKERIANIRRFLFTGTIIQKLDRNIKQAISNFKNILKPSTSEEQFIKSVEREQKILDNLEIAIDKDSKILQKRIDSGLATQKEVNAFDLTSNLIFNRQKRLLKRVDDFNEKQEAELKLIPRARREDFVGELIFQDVKDEFAEIPKDADKAGRFISQVVGTKRFDRREFVVLKDGTRVRKLDLAQAFGQLVGGTLSALGTIGTLTSFSVQERFKNVVPSGQIVIPPELVRLVRATKKVIPDPVKGISEFFVTNPLKFVKVENGKYIIVPRAAGETGRAAFDVILIFSGGAKAGRILKINKVGKPVSFLGRFKLTGEKVRTAFFNKLKVKNFKELFLKGTRISPPTNKFLRSLGKIPEFKAIRVRVIQEAKFLEAKVIITNRKVDDFLKAVNKTLRPLRKELGPIIREIKLSQKGLSKKKTPRGELKRLSSAQANVIQIEKLKDAKNLVNKRLRETFLTSSVGKKFGPVITIIRLGRKKGLSPSQSILRFARRESKAFVDPRIRQLRAVGIDVNTFRLNLTDSLIRRLFPRKLVRSLKKKFPELSKKLAIGKKRGIRKRVILKRLIKRRTITILNKTFLNQTLALKFFRKQFIKEIKEIIGLFKTLSNVSKNAVKNEFINFKNNTNLIKKLLKRPDLLLTEREIGLINKWNISRVNFIEKVQIVLGRKIPRRIRKNLGPVIKRIELSKKFSKNLIKRFNASVSLYKIKLGSLFGKLSSDTKKIVRKQHISSLTRASNTRNLVIRKILGNTITKKQATTLLINLNNDIERLKKAEIAIFRAKTRARNARRFNNIKGVRLANKQEQNAFFQAIGDFKRFEKNVKKTQFRKFKEPKARTGEKFVKTKTGQLQIIRTKTITRVKVKRKVKLKPRLKQVLILQPKPKVQLGNKIRLRAIVLARLRGLTIVQVRVIPKTKFVTRTKTRTRIITKFALRIVTTPKTVTILVTKLRIIPRLKLKLRVAVRPKIITKLKLKLKPLIKKPPKLVLVFLPSLNFPQNVSRLTRLKAPVNLFIRRSVRGKIRAVQVNTFPLFADQAAALGRSITDNTPSRTYFLRVAKRGKPRKTRVPKAVSRKKFRSPKGKTQLQLGSRVEKTRFLIDTKGERRGITLKGIRALRRRKIKGKLKRRIVKFKKRVMKRKVRKRTIKKRRKR